MEAHPCLMRFLTNLARLCASKSANGPRKNSFLPDSPVQVFAGDGRLRRRFSHTGHGPLRSLIVSNLKWGGPCRATTCYRQADIKIFRNFLKSPLMAYRIFPHTVALSGRDKVRPRT